MRIDRTWTISFEDHEQRELLNELKSIDLSSDLGWRPILTQIAATRQITLPLRAVERLSLELDIARTRFLECMPPQEYQRRYPSIAALCLEVDSILYSGKKKSA